MRLSDRWNQLLDEHEPREEKERNYLVASKLGKHPLEVILWMKAVPETNPPNLRSKRKFLAGNIWEDVVSLVLTASGAKFAPQQEVFVTDYAVPIKGYCDFLIEGTQEPNLSILPKYLQRLAKELPVEQGVKEIKSCSTYVMDDLEATDKPIRIHAFQNYIYMKGLQKKGELVYICKDDCRMKSFEFELNNEVLEEQIMEYTEEIAYYMENDILPAPAPLIIFDGRKFTKNTLDVEYSPYLSMYYGRPRTDEDAEDELATINGEIAFRTPEEYREYVEPLVRKMNALFKLIHKETPKTPKAQENLKIKIEEAKALLTKFDFNFSDDFIRSVKPVEVSEETD